MLLFSSIKKSHVNAQDSSLTNNNCLSNFISGNDKTCLSQQIKYNICLNLEVYKYLMPNHYSNLSDIKIIGVIIWCMKKSKHKQPTLK